MERTLKTILIVVIAALAAFVVIRKYVIKGGEAPTDASVAEVYPPGPFDGLGIRFDGHYRHDEGGLRYLMRFFPEGRVVTINGTKDVEATLHEFLTRDTEGNQRMGLHNVMADVRNDSIFFMTQAMRGEISHRGNVTSDSTVRFFRHSHITGKDFHFTYTFRSDALMKELAEQAKQSAQVVDSGGGQ